MKVAIIGGGVIGLSIALRLARRGVEATVLERGQPGQEATQAAAGILAPQAEATAPGPLLDLCLRSRERYPAFAEEVEALSHLPVGYRRSGVLDVAFDAATVDRLAAAVAWQRGQRLRAELLGPEEVREREPTLSTSVRGAALFPDDHQIDNRLLAAALEVAITQLGVEVRRAEAVGPWLEGERVRGVELPEERLAADAVVIAAGAWSARLGVAPPIYPVRGQMVELRPASPGPRHILFHQHGYLVPREDGRLLAGSTQEDVGFEKAVTAGGVQKILHRALTLCPSLETAEVRATWSGLRPAVRQGLPLLGEGAARGLYLATGHFRNGVLLAPITADVIASLLLGEDLGVELRPFRS